MLFLMVFTPQELNKIWHMTNKLVPFLISVCKAVKTSQSSQSNSDTVVFSMNRNHPFPKKIFYDNMTKDVKGWVIHLRPQDMLMT